MFTGHQQFGVAGWAEPAEPAPALVLLPRVALLLGTQGGRRRDQVPGGPALPPGYRSWILPCKRRGLAKAVKQGLPLPLELGEASAI